MGATIQQHGIDGQHLSLPPGLTEIEEEAFWDNLELVSVIIPDSVKVIGAGAFHSCRNLQSISIPPGIEIIDEETFKHCDSLERIVIPEGVKIIRSEAFFNCWHLREVILPQSLIQIESRAFLFCDNLIRITIPEHVQRIGEYTFDVQEYELSSYDSVKKLERYSDIAFNIHKRVLSGIPTPTLFVTQGSPAEQYVQSKAGKLRFKIVPPEGAGRLLITSEHPMSRYVHSNFQIDDLQEAITEAQIPNTIFEGIHYRDSNEVADNIVVKAAIAPYLALWDDLEYESPDYKIYRAMRIVEEADTVAKTLNPDDLSMALSEMIRLEDRETFPQRLFPYGRFANESQIELLIAQSEIDDKRGDCLADLSDIPDMVKEAEEQYFLTDDERSKAEQMVHLYRAAFLLNDSQSVMLLADQHSLTDYYFTLDRYAKIHQIDTNTLRAKRFLEFGFDKHLHKSYDLGDSVVEVRLDDQFKIQLIDRDTGETLTALPQVSADSTQLATAVSDFEEISNYLDRSIATFILSLKNDFISVSMRNSGRWLEAYSENPLLQRIGQRVLWKYVRGKTVRHFALSDHGPNLSDGTRLEIGAQGEVTVAHPIDMTSNEIGEWQDYFEKMAIKQPFEQIWEPVMSVEEVVPRLIKEPFPMLQLIELQKELGGEIGHPYEGEFSHQFRYSLPHRGASIELIPVDPPMIVELLFEDLGFYFFDFDSTMKMSAILKDVMVCVVGVRLDKASYYQAPHLHGRFNNHLLYRLETLTLAQRIAEKDDVTVIDLIKKMPLTKIEHYLEHAIQHGAKNCMAALRDLKNMKSREQRNG